MVFVFPKAKPIEQAKRSNNLNGLNVLALIDSINQLT